MRLRGNGGGGPVGRGQMVRGGRGAGAARRSGSARRVAWNRVTRRGPPPLIGRFNSRGLLERRERRRGARLRGGGTPARAAHPRPRAPRPPPALSPSPLLFPPNPGRHHAGGAGEPGERPSGRQSPAASRRHPRGAGAAAGRPGAAGAGAAGERRGAGGGGRAGAILGRRAAVRAAVTAR